MRPSDQPDIRGKRPPREPLDRDPVPPPRSSLYAVYGRVLDPATALQIEGVAPRPTAYVGPRLLVSRTDFNRTLARLRKVAEKLGWAVDEEGVDPETGEPFDDGAGLSAAEKRRLATQRRELAELRFGIRKLWITVASASATRAPDAWALLEHARVTYDFQLTKGV